MSLNSLTSEVNNLLPVYCHLSTGRLSDYQRELTSIESKCINNISASRLYEFKGGRAIAKEAANSLGIQNISILKDINGCPLWPSSLVGSISHKSKLCGALLGMRDLYKSIGFDIEKVENLDKDVWKTFSSKEEIKQAKTLNMKESEYANLIFSAKESFFKCLYPLYFPDSPILSEIFILTKPITQSYIETEVIFDNKKYQGGIVYDAEILISWALIENRLFK